MSLLGKLFGKDKSETPKVKYLKKMKVELASTDKKGRPENLKNHTGQEVKLVPELRGGSISLEIGYFDKGFKSLALIPGKYTSAIDKQYGLSRVEVDLLDYDINKKTATIGIRKS